MTIIQEEMDSEDGAGVFEEQLVLKCIDETVPLQRMLLIMFFDPVTWIDSYLAGSEDLEHERQAVRDELHRVLLFIDAAELLQETLDQRPAVLVEACAQGLKPSVQSPGDPWDTDCRSKHTWKQTQTACAMLLRRPCVSSHA